jgi:hypothetical protein
MATLMIVMQRSDEQPWAPGRDVPWQWTLLSPDGTRHLAFDNGGWLRFFADRTVQPLSVGEAMALRPSDIDTIVRWTVMWSMNEGAGTDRSFELIDELANGTKALVVYLVSARP